MIAGNSLLTGKVLQTACVSVLVNAHMLASSLHYSNKLFKLTIQNCLTEFDCGCLLLTAACRTS
jgi:hypothetical protein